MWCPFVLAAAGWPVGYAFSLFGLEPLTGFSYGVALISGVLAVPYGIYLLMMRTLWPPETEREYRRAMAVAPIGISVIAAILLLAGTAVFGGIRSSTGIRDVLFSFGYASNIFLVLAYVYVGFIELAASEFKRKRALRLGLDPQVVED